MTIADAFRQRNTSLNSVIFLSTSRLRKCSASDAAASLLTDDAQLCPYHFYYHPYPAQRIPILPLKCPLYPFYHPQTEFCYLPCITSTVFSDTVGRINEPSAKDKGQTRMPRWGSWLKPEVWGLRHLICTNLRRTVTDELRSRKKGQGCTTDLGVPVWKNASNMQRAGARHVHWSFILKIKHVNGRLESCRLKT